jgi:lipopolysaccharide transport system permease protein
MMSPPNVATRSGVEPGEVVVIRPPARWVGFGFRELWRYRELVAFLTWRDVKVRYKQTALGALWAVLQPFLTMVVFGLFFGRLAGVPSDGLPYPVFAFAALVPWTAFANSMTFGSNSLVASADLLRKVWFPRLAIPVAAVLGQMLDFVIAFLVLLALMAWYGITPTGNIVWLPALLALALMTALGASFWLSALNVQYRDVRYAVPFLVQLWLFATPIAYPSSLLHEPWRTWYALNPMAGVVEGFRWALLGVNTRPGAMALTSAGAAVLLFATGLVYFRRMSRNFADIV